MRKPPDRLTFYLEGPKITAERFVRAVNAFFDLITEVAEQIEGRKRPVRWIVSVEPGSVQLNADPLPGRPYVDTGLIATKIVEGTRQLDRTAKRPAYFSDTALRKVRELGSVADGVEVERAKIRVQRKAASVRHDAVANVDRILGVSARDYGTIEGRLETISVHGGAHLAVYDSLTEQKVECIIDPLRLEEAWGAFGKRVAVFGLIRYNRAGNPLSIEMESFEVLPEQSELPTAEEVYGILSKI